MSKFRQLHYLVILFGTFAVLTISVLAGCGSSSTKAALPGVGINIMIASNGDLDSQLNAEMYALLLGANGYNVTIEPGDTPTCGCPVKNWTPSLLSAAISNGDIQMFPEFTGTAIDTYGLPSTTNAQQAYNEASAYYEQTFHVTWLVPAFGLDDTYGYCTTQTKAKQLGLTTIASLVPVAPRLVLGANLADPQTVVYPPVERAYGLRFKTVVSLNFTHQYDFAAVQSGQVDIIECYTTDPRIVQDNFVLLQDDQHAFPVFNPAPIVRDDLLNRSPAIKGILNPLAGNLTTATIDTLIAEVSGGQTIHDVAQAFLKSEGLLR